jgi:aerobic-type carbon monoxide dehydrogenase small subunit (CoxS/CutS family)
MSPRESRVGLNRSAECGFGLLRLATTERALAFLVSLDCRCRVAGDPFTGIPSISPGEEQAEAEEESEPQRNSGSANSRWNVGHRQKPTRKQIRAPCSAREARDILSFVSYLSRSGDLVSEPVRVDVSVNGIHFDRPAEPRLLLSDFLRHELGLTGTHVGCEHGVCGACTVLLDGEPVRSCLLFAVQADGREITTVEGLAPAADALNPLQTAFRESHGVQCGFCTPGILMTMTALLRDHPDADDSRIREALSGHLCRCTGYQQIVRAVRLAAERMAPK